MRRLLAAAAFALCAAACATRAQTAPAPPTFRDAAEAPFSDLGLVRPEAPEMLAGIEDPYTLQGAARCTEIAREIETLDALLGYENYGRKNKKGVGEMAHGAAVSAAEDATTGFIPFRSWVRRLSGATRAERDVALAIEKGRARRAFLRGLSAGRRCQPPPAPPAPPLARAPY